MRLAIIYTLMIASCLADSIPMVPRAGDHLALPFSVRVGPVLGQKTKLMHFPELKNQIVPEYPRTMRIARIHGSSVVRFEIDRDGRVTKCSLLKQSQPEFGSAAITAAKQWSFGPAIGHDRQATAVTLDYEFVFTIFEDEE